MNRRGASGVDGETMQEFERDLDRRVRYLGERLRQGTYRAPPVRRVDIPKGPGKEGTRPLGIPTVEDRLLQRAIARILEAVFEADFLDCSYGFRPGRNPHGALRALRGIVVTKKVGHLFEADIRGYFNHIQHDWLLKMVAHRIGDPVILRLIGKWLNAGFMAGGVVTRTEEGSPQGGPLSPLLSNILLTDWDRELEKHGHAFCRYADDCNIYVRSEAAGQRVMAAMKVFLEERLKLQVNAAKSACARPWKRKFLGYTLTNAGGRIRLKVAHQSVARLTGRVRELLRQGRGRSLTHTIETLNPVLRGWVGYFQLSESKTVWKELDGWLRRRLRCLLWRQAKTRQRRTAMLRKRGLPEARAWHSGHNGQGPWWNSGASHMNHAFPKAFFDRLRLVSMSDTSRYLQRHS
ncbi:group II intron reverse transcriptase/maturase [Acidiferrobacter sp. SPIII_3]|nr:group II intron reverse transcriptase/maturase [Acidiferrobacter sp. SPIII_3]